MSGLQARVLAGRCQYAEGRSRRRSATSYFPVGRRPLSATCTASWGTGHIRIVLQTGKARPP